MHTVTESRQLERIVTPLERRNPAGASGSVELIVEDGGIAMKHTLQFRHARRATGTEPARVIDLVPGKHGLRDPEVIMFVDVSRILRG